MDKLQLKILNNKPAEINFNYDEISKNLDEALKQYTGIIVTEDTVKDGKKIIADLRKGKKSLDEFRKKVKKDLTAPVTEFEKQCKELSKQFDEVIDPIVKQSEEFEEKRKAEKKIEVEKIINVVCESKQINNLQLDEKYLNKSMSLKAIKEDLINVANQMLLEKSNYEKNINLIEGKVELANAKYDVTMLKEPYITMLEYKEIDEILNKILEDGENLKNKLKAESKIVTPLENNSSDEIFMEVYEIEGTEEQLDKLETFLKNNEYKWKIQD